MNNIEEGCCVVECERPLDQEYWDNQWKAESTGWDLGKASPPLVSFIDSIEDKDASILIPGCGNAHEAEYLLERGFQNITLIDISPTATDILRNKFNGNSKITVKTGDFFDLTETFDLIIEQTFFCALPPTMRQKYVWKMHNLLKPKGNLAGLLFNRDFDGGPPFGGSKEEYEKLFSSAFHFNTIESASNSVEPRMSSELFVKFQKNSDIVVSLYSFNGITCNGCKSSVTNLFSEIDGVKNVTMSTDFKEVLIVSEKEIPLTLLGEKILYDKDYSISKLKTSI